MDSDEQLMVPCGNPNCVNDIPDSKVACMYCWGKLPQHLRTRILKTQPRAGRPPSIANVRAKQDAEKWFRDHG